MENCKCTGFFLDSQIGHGVSKKGQGAKWELWHIFNTIVIYSFKA